jgi:hypothetical protein
LFLEIERQIANKHYPRSNILVTGSRRRLPEIFGKFAGWNTASIKSSELLETSRFRARQFDLSTYALLFEEAIQLD